MAGVIDGVRDVVLTVCERIYMGGAMRAYASHLSLCSMPISIQYFLNLLVYIVFRSRYIYIYLRSYFDLESKCTFIFDL